MCVDYVICINIFHPICFYKKVILYNVIKLTNGLTS